MGLDTYAARTPVDFFDPGLDESQVDEHFGCTRRDLWALRRAQRRRERANGGYCVFERNYFRGKLYVDLVEYVSGVRLSQIWIPPKTVARISEAFERCDPEETIRGFAGYEHAIYDHSPAEIADLAAYFGVCARRGLGLVGSW
jgi:hypothetical protein